MYIQGMYESPEEFLARAHQRMIEKYAIGEMFGIGNIEEEKIKAKKLQDFFAALKNYEQIGQSSDNPMMNAAIKRIYDILKANTTHGELFQRFGGTTFENELSSVIRRTYEATEIQLSQETINSFKVGQDYSTTLADFTKGVVKDFAASIGKNIEKTIQISDKSLPPQLQNIIKLTGVQQKTDVQGGQLNLQFNESVTNPYLKEIVSILNEATFTAKNYGSAIEDIASLKLGMSHPVRSIGSALANLGFSNEEINEFFIDMSHRREYYKNNSVMKNQLFELQFMYELTGAGSVSTKNFQSLSETKYLIYNNPITSEIYVQSTAALIRQVLESPEHWMPSGYDPFEHYKISVARKANFWNN